MRALWQGIYAKVRMAEVLQPLLQASRMACQTKQVNNKTRPRQLGRVSFIVNR